MINTQPNLLNIFTKLEPQSLYSKTDIFCLLSFNTQYIRGW